MRELAHSIFIWDAGDKAYAVSVDNTELNDVDIFEITNPAAPQPVAEYDLTDDRSGVDLDGDRQRRRRRSTTTWSSRRSATGMVMLASYWDAGYVKLDVTDPANATLHRRLATSARSTR